MVQSDDGETLLKCADGTRFFPITIAANILKKMKNIASSYLKTPVKNAIVTIPSFYDESERRLIMQAGSLAGLNILQLINDTTAAALTYHRTNQKDKTIVVHDFGGGSCKISVIKIHRNVPHVISVIGNSWLGGEDFDNAIIDYLAFEFKEKQGIDVTKDAMAMKRLKEVAEKAKIKLSSFLRTDINFPNLTMDSSGPKHLKLKLSRCKFENLVDNLIKQSVQLCEKALSDAKVTKLDIEEVLIVGGMTRVPKVQGLF